MRHNENIVDTPLYAEAQELIDRLAKMTSAMSSERQDAFATALANEHPTLLGQIAKAVGIGVMRRATRNPAWGPFDKWEQACPGQPGEVYANGANATPHADHDGRLDCTTIIGADLMARQSFI